MNMIFVVLSDDLTPTPLLDKEREEILIDITRKGKVSKPILSLQALK